MNNSYPIYTLENECQDCYKCIRHCPVKAIKIQDGHASVIAEKCIACGTCVTVCPQNAKRVRNDVRKVENIILQRKKVIVSLAPSWCSSFKATNRQLITALKKLGFWGVSETALGAEEVSIETARLLSQKEIKLSISSACPAAVDYIRLYAPAYAKNITPIASPALTHGKMLRNLYGNDIAVVFIGPCSAKKNEADKHPEIIDVALTFEELKEWFKEQQIELKNIEENTQNSFVPHSAHEGAIYPIEGGMNETIRKCGVDKDVQLINVSSIKSLKDALNGLDLNDIKAPVFIEALACSGGCINGPCNSEDSSEVLKVSKVLSGLHEREIIPDKPKVVLTEKYEPAKIPKCEYSFEEINETMKSIGKFSIEDELNCGGCGYDTCRQLANALLSGEAEPSMCISYMRKISTKKAGAMLRFMPSGIVMVDANLKIIETNEAFLKMFAKDLYDVFKSTIDDIAGASIDKIIPCCSDIFKSALRSGRVIHKEHYPINDGLFDITLFTIEDNQIVGAVITDVTKTEMRRDQIAKKAQDVINKNITVVQDIACMLGEHMVDTEMLLSSIAEGYNPEDEGTEK